MVVSKAHKQQNQKEAMRVGLAFSYGERKLWLEPGKTKYLMRVKGMSKQDAEAALVSEWARDLILSVSKAYSKLED